MDYKILFALTGCLFLLNACERNAGGKAKLSIQFPNVVQTLSKTADVTAQDSSQDQWSSVTPTGFTGNAPINCFGVYISGPEESLRANKCFRSGESTPVKYVGKWKGGVPAGQSLEFEIDSGKDRVVGVFGFHAVSASACKDFTGNAKMDKSLLSKPHLLGEKGRLEFLPGQTLPVSIDLSFDANKSFDDCYGPDFQGGSSSGPSPSPSPAPSPAYVDFGNGSDGDLTVTSGLTDVRNTTSPLKSVPLITTSRVENITMVNGNPLLLTLTTRLTSLPSKFVVGDEVALYVAASMGSISCGPQVVPGFRARGIVQSVSTQTMNVQVDDSRFSTIPNSSLIASSSGAGRDFCRMVVTRVPNFNILTFQGSGGYPANLDVNAASFGEMVSNSVDHEAGIMIIRVKDKIVMLSDGGVNVAGRGFTGGNQSLGLQYRDGQGTSGASYVNPTGTSIGSGGAGSVSSEGPGGGGHGGAGGIGVSAIGPAGGIIQGDQYGCNSSVPDPQMKCLFGKIFIGGGGGSGYDAAGGSGGGIISLNAKTIQLNSFKFELNADGESSFAGSTSGGGGGAGGSVLLNTENVIGTTASAQLKLHSNGGISKMNSGNLLGKGGSGGGGRNHLNIVGGCSLVGASAISMESYSPGSYESNQGGSGSYGTNFLSGTGIASCGGIAQNQSPRVMQVNPGNVTADTSNGAIFTIYGEGLGGISASSITLRHTSTLTDYVCQVGLISANKVTCTTTAPDGQYHITITGSTGHKSTLNSGITLSP